MHTFLDLRLEEYYHLNNMFVEVEEYDQTSDVDRFHPNNGDPINLTDSIFPHAIYDLTWFTKCCYLFFRSSIICQEFKSLQLFLMVLANLVKFLNHVIFEYSHKILSLVLFR